MLGGNKKGGTTCASLGWRISTRTGRDFIVLVLWGSDLGRYPDRKDISNDHQE